MHAYKLSMGALIVVFFCLTICASLSASIWLSKWTDKAKGKTLGNNTSAPSSSSSNQIHDMNIYSALGITQGNKVCFYDFFQFNSLTFKVFLHSPCS
jgi:hypothetical protein